MMSKQSERERFILAADHAGIDHYTATLLLRHAKSLQRYAEAQCNGDWPYDNGERKVVPCSRCEAGCVPSAMRKDSNRQQVILGGMICPDCRVSDRVRVLCKPLPVEPVFQGDPRGWVLHLVTPEGREIGVPS